jgi:GT2 family glycosyltransferase
LWQPDAEMADHDPLVIIVAFRNTDSLGDALCGLGPGSRVIVVDNGDEGEVRRLAERHGAEYMTPGRNIGFAAAVNLGMSRRDRENVLLLNPDARVSHETVKALVTALEADRTVCAVAPAIVGDDGLPQRVEWPIPSPRVELAKALRLERLLPPRETFLIGAVLLLRAEALDDVGPFDERFFLYAEECDWQLRALRRGWRVKVVHGVQAGHAGGGSSADARLRDVHFYRSAALFGLKWYGRRGWALMRIASAGGAALRLIVSLPVASRRRHYARELGR